MARQFLIAGATGATGRLLTQQLLERGHHVRVIVRSADRLPDEIRNHPHLAVTVAPILDLSDDEMAALLEGCAGVASCLGHNLTLKGLYGKPRRLVTDATRRLCDAIRANRPAEPVRFVLMNTTGNRNRDLDEPLPLPDRAVTGLLRHLLPPQADNEQAADALRLGVGQNDPHIEWAAVRPDSLVDEAAVTSYQLHPSPVRSPVFDAGKTSRSNVAHFMADLLTDSDLWERWKGQMPVIYNQAQEEAVLAAG